MLRKALPTDRAASSACSLRKDVFVDSLELCPIMRGWGSNMVARMRYYRIPEAYLMPVMGGAEPQEGPGTLSNRRGLDSEVDFYEPLWTDRERRGV
jgi:hypothetical protein